MEADVIEYEARDPALFERHNIRCEFVGACKNNSIIVANDDARASRSLCVSYGGSGNVTRLFTVPNGIIHPVEDNSYVEVKGRTVELDLWLYRKSRFVLGDDSVIFGLWAAVYNDTSLTIGRDCLFAEHVSIYTSDHHSIIDLETGRQMNFPADVVVHDHVWIGHGVRVLKGAEVGKGSIIAAGSLVTASVPPCEAWGGVPARRMRKNVSWVASHPAHPHDVQHLLASMAQPLV